MKLIEDLIQDLATVPHHMAVMRAVALLRSAASTDAVMREWSPERGTLSMYYRDKHNAEVASAKVRIAAMEDEIDRLTYKLDSCHVELLNEKSRVADITDERDARQRAIESIVTVWDGRPPNSEASIGGMIVEGIRRFVTPQAKPTPQPIRKWQREYPVGVRYWLSWDDGDRRQVQLRNLWTTRGFTNHDDDSWALVWQDGDTQENLPPIPKAEPVIEGHPDLSARLEETREMLARLAGTIISLSHGLRGTLVRDSCREVLDALRTPAVSKPTPAVSPVGKEKNDA